MNTLYLCVIGISGYDGPNFVLGIFDDVALAQAAQQAFIQTYKTENNTLEVLTQRERWIELEEIKISEHLCDISQTGAYYYIVSRFSEGFGQIYRDIDAIFDSYNDALNKLLLLEKAFDEEEASFPEYFAIEKFEINKINDKTIPQWLAGDFFGDDKHCL
ncbi:hypothetical protein [Proteus hauseri]|uniref:hypothetical protein n=1 Tax=Proteus hauseri TaxID=183417 RepID=UPI0032DA9DB2